jgi:predicted dehydrogenase
MNGPLIGIVGARRARQGLGPFIARDLAKAGAQIVAFTATSEESVQEASRQLSTYGVRATGFTSIEAMLDQQKLDAVAILSPPEHHETALDWAWTAGCHVLCEKPLVQPASGADASRLVDQFAGSGLLLEENCQWPRVLDAARELVPTLGIEPVERFEMELCPEARGVGLVRDAMSHPLSLLQSLTNHAGAVINVAFGETDPDTGFTVVRFDFLSASQVTACEVRLFRTEMRPRPASFAVNGQQIQRLIREPGYTFHLSHGDRLVGCTDPLTAHLNGWVERLSATLSGARPERATGIEARADMLETLVSTFNENDQ